MTDTRKVLFVCTANICRSPMAEAIFNDLAVEKGLPFVAESAGIRDMGGQEMAPYSQEALREIGIETTPHTSRKITEEMISNSNLILVMERRHVRKVEDKFGESDRLALLSDFATSGVSTEEISDPYGLTMFAYRASVRQLHGFVTKAVERIARDEGFLQ